MLSLKYIRNNTELVNNSLIKKGSKVDISILLEFQWRYLKFKLIITLLQA